MPPAPEPLAPLPRAYPLPVIGLVGGIGSGKSTVAKMLGDEGCMVCDSDALAREALTDPAVTAQLHAWWGDAAADRTQLAHLVFQDSAKRNQLESVIHPWIERRRRQIFAQPPQGTVALVIDAPLLLEAGLDKQCDAILFVDTPLEQRQSRVLSTRGWAPEEHSRREAHQWPLDRKRISAHHVLRNDGSSDALRAQVRQVLSKVRAGQ
jgi:dephospho-CoA kinase